MEYNASNIKILKGLEAVRKRPAMYIGDIGERGLHHLIFEIVDNSIDEALMGFCKNIKVSISKGVVEVEDDGRGIPVDVHPETGKSALEVVATTLHAGGKFEKKVYQVSGGLHGVGMSVVNALSEWMEITVKRNGKIYRQRYKRGIPETDVEIIGKTEGTGTTVRFKPDAEIFRETEFKDEIIVEKLKELAYLNKGIHIEYENKDNGRKEIFEFEGGIKQFVEDLTKNYEKIGDIIYGEKSLNNVKLEFSMVYTNAYIDKIYSFANNIRTIEGGVHVAAFRAALTRAINEFIKANNLLKGKKVRGEDVIEGLTAVINVKVPEPQFEGQTKTKLGNNELRGPLESAYYDEIKKYLHEHYREAQAIVAKIARAMEAREAAQKARELIRKQESLGMLPGKLADCTSKNFEERELYIVEGDSAGGSAKQARDRKRQAILPLKGKVLNVEKASLNKMLNNDEIKTIIVALGTGINEKFDINKLRYNKIIIMTDADVDGSHIRTLLLTLFYRYFKPIIEKGHLYIAQPPLYKIKKGKKQYYAYSDEELKQILAELGDADIQRYKGLGEMNPNQLWETTMDPERALLKRVTIEDAEKADELFRILMGDDVQPRKEFIIKNAKQVENLDI